MTDDGDGIVTRDGTAVSPKSNRNFDQAAARAAAFFRFLRQPNKPNAPRPVANSGRAAGRRAALGEVRLNMSLLTTALYSSRQTLLGLAEQFFPSRNPPCSHKPKTLNKLSTGTKSQLFGPHCNGSGAFLDRPLILAAWNDGVAIGFSAFPTRAKARRVEFPSAGAFLARLSTRLTGHFPVRGESHLELGAARS